MKATSLSKALVNGWVFAAAMSGTASAQPQCPPPKTAGSNSLEVVPSDGMFQAFGSGSQALNEMRARLEDPQQRAKIREDQLKSIADNHYGVADALQLDTATFGKLIELLADQQMEQSEYFHSLFAGKVPANPTDRMRGEAERVTKNIEALREVLGQEKLERYQNLRFSLGQRRQVREFEERLDASDKLSGTQRERLVELLNEHIVSSMEQWQMLQFQRSPFNGDLRAMPSREEMQRRSQLHTIASNEETWRNMLESNRRLREKASGFLTERQLAMLAKMHEEQRSRLQQSIEHMRVQAGLSPTIPEQAQVAEVTPATVDRDVKLSLMASVNNENPRYLTTVVSSGKSVSLKIAEGLFLEATPIVFENDAYNLRVQYFEEGVAGRRVIGNSGLSGRVMQASQDGGSRHVGGGGGSVLTGSKGYAVQLSALVEST